MNFTVYLGVSRGTNIIFAMIAAIPPLILVYALSDALYRMKGSGGQHYNLSAGQVVLQLVGVSLFAISEILIWTAPMKKVPAFTGISVLYFILSGIS